MDSKEQVSLKEHIETLITNNDRRYEQRFNDTKIAVDAALIAADKAVAAALAGQKEAVTKAEVAAEKRFESVNEFRSTLADQQRSLMPRAEFEVQHKALIDILAIHSARIDKSEGKGIGIAQVLGWILFGITVVAFLIDKLK